MKEVIVGFGTVLLIFFQSCNGNQMNEPTRTDFLGTWKSADQAKLVFNNDGTFMGELIPATLGFFPADSFVNVKFSGSGKWALRKGNSNWEVNLDFDKVSGVNKSGCSFPLLIAGKNGVLENKKPWYLFAWKEEEGGERYSFIQQ
jgi:hypothetical protein